MENQTITTKTFKEVHAEIENEHLFLHKSHDIRNFKDKADFLGRVGFTNSIATKLYAAVAGNSNVIHDYARKYHGQYKFILKPQLERVCEKYNLFVRATNMFLGDIPEKNVKDMMGFSVYVDDLPIDRWNHREWFSQYKHLIKGNEAAHITSMRPEPKIPIQNLREMRLGNLIQIAAIESLFDPIAFKDSRARILNRSELAAKHQVDLDPIVLCETKHGYIIITAWGDEANDELVVNQNHN